MLKDKLAISNTVIDEKGAVYTYQWDEDQNQWVEDEQILQPDDLPPNAQFGSAVSISGDLLVIGAKNDNSVYTYQWNGQAWDFADKLTMSTGGQYGAAVATYEEEPYGQWLVVGAPGANNGSGNVHIYKRWKGAWKFMYLKSEPGSVGCGTTVGINFIPSDVDRGKVPPGALAVGAPESGPLKTGMVYTYVYAGPEMGFIKSPGSELRGTTPSAECGYSLDVKYGIFTQPPVAGMVTFVVLYGCPGHLASFPPYKPTSTESKCDEVDSSSNSECRQDHASVLSGSILLAYLGLSGWEHAIDGFNENIGVGSFNDVRDPEEDPGFPNYRVSRQGTSVMFNPSAGWMLTGQNLLSDDTDYKTSGLGGRVQYLAFVEDEVRGRRFALGRPLTPDMFPDNGEDLIDHDPVPNSVYNPVLAADGLRAVAVSFETGIIQSVPLCPKAEV